MKTPTNETIFLQSQASVADPAHLIWWSVKNPDTTYPSLPFINSSGTRWQRFLIRLLSKSIQRSLVKGVR